MDISLESDIRIFQIEIAGQPVGFRGFFPYGSRIDDPTIKAGCRNFPGQFETMIFNDRCCNCLRRIAIIQQFENHPFTWALDRAGDVKRFILCLAILNCQNKE